MERKDGVPEKYGITRGEVMAAPKKRTGQIYFYVVVAVFSVIFVFWLSAYHITFNEELMESKLNLEGITFLLNNIQSDNVVSLMRSGKRQAFIRFVFDDYEKKYIVNKNLAAGFLRNTTISFNSTFQEIKEIADVYARHIMGFELNSPEFFQYVTSMEWKIDNNLLANIGKDEGYACFITYIYLLMIRDDHIEENDIVWINQRKFSDRTLESFWVHLYNRVFIESFDDYTYRFNRLNSH
ncbi:MAG: hypothetical protein Q4A41_04430 [Bacillota bacterium]|nr:hypothetical protein [Bacillota bacterium]